MSIKITLVLFTVCLGASNIWVNAVPEPAFSELVSGLNQLNTVIADFESKAAAETDADKKKALEDGIAALKFVGQNGDDIRTNLTDLDDRTGQSTIGRVSDAKKELRDWQRGQVSRVRRATLGFGVGIALFQTGPVVRRNSQALDACQKDVVALNNKAQTELKAEMDNYSVKVNKLIADMNNCQQATTTAAQCQQTIDASAQEFANAPNDVMKFRANGRPMFIAELTGAKCVADAKTKMQEEMKNTEKNLDKLNFRNCRQRNFRG